MRTRKVNPLPQHAVGRKVYYVAPNGRKITAVIDSIDSKIDPARFVLRITAKKDPAYRTNLLVSTPPAFVMVR